AFKPDAANVDNYTEFDIYTKVYQKQINVSGEEVSAIVYEYSVYDDWYCEVSADFEDWIDVSIYYKDMFIIVRAKPSVLTDEFWQSFSMG
ncbi:MAG: hypothetical protein IKB23_06015, partial [Clostridia bacterium]|nr:hypothetical protein [Clostridia bacterium]